MIFCISQDGSVSSVLGQTVSEMNTGSPDGNLRLDIANGEHIW